MNSVGSTLWIQLQAFPLGDSFTQQLSHQQHWPPAFAASVVEEYRRFLYLAATSPSEVTPSLAVDAAWHLHLANPASYEHHLCGTILGTPLLHIPGNGSFADEQRHREQYDYTLAQYEIAFGERPPASIWPRRQATHRGELYPWPAIAIVSVLGIGCAMAAWATHGCGNIFSNAFLSGPKFLLLFMFAMLTTFVIALLVRHNLRTPVVVSDDVVESLSAYDLAYLAGRERLVTRTALAVLYSRGLMHTVTRDGKPAPSPTALPTTCKLHPVESALLSTPTTFAKAADEVIDPCEAIKQRLTDDGLLVPQSATPRLMLVPTLLMVVPLAIGAIRLNLGLQTKHPSEILAVSMIVAVPLTLLVFIRQAFRSLAGDGALSYHKSRVQPLSAQTDDAERIGLHVSLYDLHFLPGDHFASLKEAYPQTSIPSSSDGSGGSSCGGGAGCGGGCGGGGD